MHQQGLKPGFNFSFPLNTSAVLSKKVTKTCTVAAVRLHRHFKWPRISFVEIGKLAPTALTLAGDLVYVSK